MSLIRVNFFYNLLLTISNIIFPIITFPYASRILGPFGIGKIQFINTYVQYFILIAALGIPIYGIREIAKVKGDRPALVKLFSELLTLNLGMCFILFFIYIASAQFIPELHADFNFYAVAALLLIFSFCNVDWFFSGLERFKFIAFRSVIIKFSLVVALFVLVKDKDDDLIYLAILVGTSVLNNFWNMWSARSYYSLKSFNLIDFKKHFRPLLFIFSTVAAISVYALLDTIILGFLKDFEAVGYYSAASRVNKITIPLLTSLGTVLIPQIASAFKTGDNVQVKSLTKSSLSFVIMFGVPLSIGLIVLAPEIMMLFSGPAFAPAVLSMQIYAPVVLIIGLSNVYAIQVLTPSGNDKYVTISVFIGLVLSLVLNFTLVPYLSYLGSSLANVLSELGVMIAFIYYSAKVIKIDFDIKFAMKTFISSILFVPITLIIRYYFEGNSIVICMLSVLACGVLYACLQLFVIKNELVLQQYKTIKLRIGL